ncbi:hypothetical protein Tco_0589762, partial [Tanacetum coccineum]
MDPPQKDPPLRAPLQRTPLDQPSKGPSQKALSWCLTLVHSLVKLEPQWLG